MADHCLWVHYGCTSQISETRRHMSREGKKKHTPESKEQKRAAEPVNETSVGKKPVHSPKIM